jgi:hypothetical protein
VGSEPLFNSDVTEIETVEHDGVISETLGWTVPIEYSGAEPGLADAGLSPLSPDEGSEDAPPAEDPSELATEPPESAGSREDETPVDPHDPDDNNTDADEAGAGAGTEGESG